MSSTPPPPSVNPRTVPQSPNLCAVVARTRHGVMIAEMMDAAANGAGMVELRLDYLAKAPDFKRLFEKKPCQIITTIRRKSDGGKYLIKEEERQALLRQAIVGGTDWVDLEWDVIDKIPRFGKVKRIVSYHNFQEIPSDIVAIYQKMCSSDADVVKVACMAKSPDDNWRILELFQGAPKPTVAFCMGEMGFPSRILGGILGAPFAYAVHNPDRVVAPGLPSLKQMRSFYFYPRINKDTKVFGVVGDPIAHSMSPAVHNAAFRQTNFHGVYLPFLVPEQKFQAFLKGALAFGVQGLSVTIPHKEAAASAAVVSDAIVRSTSSANTLVKRDQGWEAFNTDYKALVESLLISLPPMPNGDPADLKARQVLLLGAGGVARSIAFALLQQGAIVTITNRTPERAQRLAQALNCRHIDWATRHNVLADIVINATSVGMYPNENETPLHPSFFRPGLIVFDTVYNPESTLFVKDARERGSVVITGLELFIRQAAAQFTLFTGKPAPVEMMRQVARTALARAITNKANPSSSSGT